MESLFTPWRHRYISMKPETGDCFFCAAAEDPDDPESLVVLESSHHLVLLNRYPYTNGHLMVAAREHLAEPRLASAAARAELLPLALRCQEALQRLYDPDGFNLGMNLGRAAGAGVPEHYHLHVVPRWHADTSFVSVVGGVRLIPDELSSVWSRLRSALASGEDG